MAGYLLFYGDSYYPSGGWGDYHGTYLSVEEAKANIGRRDWWHVVDIQTGFIVDESLR